MGCLSNFRGWQGDETHAVEDWETAAQPAVRGISWVQESLSYYMEVHVLQEQGSSKLGLWGPRN